MKRKEGGAAPPEADAWGNKEGKRKQELVSRGRDGV